MVLVRLDVVPRKSFGLVQMLPLRTPMDQLTTHPINSLTQKYTYQRNLQMLDKMMTNIMKSTLIVKIVYYSQVNFDMKVKKSYYLLPNKNST